MTIEKRIDLRNNAYYVRIEVEYKSKDNGICLCLKNFTDDYYDGGDFSNIILFVKENYTYEISKNYNTGIGFLNDALYLYNHIPFLSGIRCVYQNVENELPYSMDYITKKELDKFIKENNIKMKDNSNFKLYDEKTWSM